MNNTTNQNQNPINKELAKQISDLINNPDLPEPLYNYFSQALTDFFNDDIDQTAIVEFQHSPRYIEMLLDNYVDEEVSE